MDVKNPFIVHGYLGPEYFCDREEETKQIISALRNGRNLTLMSPRRMGKTGLILHAFHQMQQDNRDVVCFYLDIFPTKNLHSFVSLFARTVLGKADTLTQSIKNSIGNIFKNLRPTLSTDPMTGALSVSVDFKPQESENTLAEIFNYLRDSGRECYIAIDEFQQIAEYPEEESMEALLRSYVQFTPNVHFVFSGSKQHLMSAIFDSPKRPFYRSTQKVNLYPIPEKSYYLFAADWMSKMGIALPQEVFHNLYTTFDGHTWYMQSLLNRLCEKAPAQVSKDVLTDCLSDIIQSEQDNYARLFQLLTINQSQLLKAIADEGIVKSINGAQFINKYRLKGTSSINKALSYLLDNEYVYHNDQGYMVYDRFMSVWLKSL